VVESDPSASEDSGVGGGTSHGSRCSWGSSCQLLVQRCVGFQHHNAISVVHVGCGGRLSMANHAALLRLNTVLVSCWITTLPELYEQDVGTMTGLFHCSPCSDFNGPVGRASGRSPISTAG